MCTHVCKFSCTPPTDTYINTGYCIPMVFTCIYLMTTVDALVLDMETTEPTINSALER